MSKVELYEEYTREEVNNIFNADVPFTPGAGIYGIHGLIRVKKEDSNPDFIFFVTIGQDKLGYEFIEEISEDGKLNWQSQPKQTLDDERIIQLINHNEDEDNIYLFIRHGKEVKEYLYLGNLSYVSHDTTKEKPVHFVWKIIQWSQDSIDKLQEIGIEVVNSQRVNTTKEKESPLIEESPPKVKTLRTDRKIQATNNDGELYKPDYIALQKKRSEIGKLGEQLVFEKEKEYLISNGYPELAAKVNKISDTNDKVGYDILSYDLDESKKYIEVKTTTGGKGLGFHISANEVKVSNENPDNYYIYRVFNYNQKRNTGRYYVVKGSIEENFNLIPSEYKVTYNLKD